MSITKKLDKALAIFFSLFLVFSFTAFISANIAQAQDTDTYGLDAAGKISIGKSADLKDTIANIINIALGFLGIVAVVIIIYAGFKWMTAAGNEDQAGEAKKMITQAVAGLVVIFLAWVIANFAIDRIGTATGKDA